MHPLNHRALRLCLAAWEGVRGRWGRSVLAAAGLMVGVAAVSLMVAVSTGAKSQILDRVKALGSNLLTVRAAKLTPSGTRSATVEKLLSLTLDDARALARLDGAMAAVPLVVKSWRVAYGENLADTTVVAAGPGVFPLEEHSPARGRLFTAEEQRQRRRVAVVGPALRQSLAGEASLVGRRIAINKQPFLVVGELAAKGVDSMGEDLDQRVYLPLSTALSRLLGGRLNIEQITLQAASASEMPALAAQAEALLRGRHHLRPGQRNDFRISSQLEVIEAQESSSHLFSLLTVGVASLSLLVAGVGIMAVMLISVRERTGEIGVRRAVGARRSDLLWQFLLEALILGLAGAGSGAVLGLLLSAAWRGISGLSHPLPVSAALWACAVALAITLAFGLWPARKAAALPPAQAVRQE